MRTALLAVLLAPAAGAQPALVGGDPVERWACHLYAAHALVTRSAPDELGETIWVVRRHSPGAAACGAPPAEAVLTVGGPGGAQYAVGLVGPYLLIDGGTGPEGRTLEVIDVERGVTAWSGTFGGDTVEVESDGRLAFLVPLDGRPPGQACPEDVANGWGGSYGFDERVRLDPRTGVLERTGELSCSYRQ